MITKITLIDDIDDSTSIDIERIDQDEHVMVTIESKDIDIEFNLKFSSLKSAIDKLSI